jgi:hypothetical protein
MSRILGCLFLVAAISVGFADAPPVTTQPTNDEMEDLRAQVKALQQENDLLRSTLAAAGRTLPAPATVADKPLSGIEALLQEFPSNEMPGPDDDGTLELRHSLLAKWIQNHAVGRTISLHARFVSASGINNNAFEVQASSPDTAVHGFVVHMNLPELQAPTIVDFKRGVPVQVTGQIGDLTLNWVGNGGFSLTITLVHPTLAPEHGTADTAGTNRPVKRRK